MRAHNGLHGDASFELFDNVTRLFLLVPADKSIEHKNCNLDLRTEQKKGSPGRLTLDDTKVDPVSETGSKDYKDQKLEGIILWNCTVRENG